MFTKIRLGQTQEFQRVGIISWVVSVLFQPNIWQSGGSGFRGKWLSPVKEVWFETLTFRSLDSIQQSKLSRPRKSKNNWFCLFQFLAWPVLRFEPLTFSRWLKVCLLLSHIVGHRAILKTRVWIKAEILTFFRLFSSSSARRCQPGIPTHDHQNYRRVRYHWATSPLART